MKYLSITLFLFLFAACNRGTSPEPGAWFETTFVVSSTTTIENCFPITPWNVRCIRVQAEIFPAYFIIEKEGERWFVLAEDLEDSTFHPDIENLVYIRWDFLDRVQLDPSLFDANGIIISGL